MAHCLLHLSVVVLCVCLALVLLGGLVFHLPVVLVQQEERFTEGLEKVCKHQLQELLWHKCCCHVEQRWWAV